MAPPADGTRGRPQPRRARRRVTQRDALRVGRHRDIAVGEHTYRSLTSVGHDQAADIAGIRAFGVHAKDDEARSFYERFDFIPSPVDPCQLFILLKDLRAILRPDGPARFR